MSSSAPNNTGMPPLEEYWSNWVDHVCECSQTLGAVLRSARPIELHEDILVIEVFHKFHRQQLQKPAMLQVLRKSMAAVSQEEQLQQLQIRTANTPEVESILIQIAEETLVKQD